MTEVWKPIENYEGLYEVSNFGNVRRLETVEREKSWTGGERLVRHKSRLLKPGTTKRGYLLVVLCDKGRHKSHMVHRLVASAFCSRTEGFDVVNHIDNNPRNNRSDNLEWCTQYANVHHAISIGARKL